jgi:quercetin dioxygenase-like cupin family protein
MKANEFQDSTIFKIDNAIEYSSGGIVSKQIIQRSVGNVTLFAFDKGQRLSEHTAPFDALINVIDGVGEIVINKIPYKVMAGESIIMPANISHAVNATEKFKMALTMIKE